MANSVNLNDFDRHIYNFLLYQSLIALLKFKLIEPYPNVYDERNNIYLKIEQRLKYNVKCIQN